MSPTVEKEILPFRDVSQTIEARVKDLLSRLTLVEKIDQMRNNCAEIARLDIPAYDFWGEALHGVGRNGRSTVFPQAIGMAATWDTALIKKVGTAIGTEARAKHHADFRRHGKSFAYQGITFWSPNINIFRDPRWGRGQETWGEDPYLTGEMASGYVRGMQGDDPRYLRTAVTAKHLAVHSGPEKERHGFDARVSKRELFDTYLPAFKKLVTEANVEMVMTAFNRLNGIPCSVNEYLISDILRKRWGFKGHVVSDCAALTDSYQTHHYTRNVVETAAQALRAGVDSSCMCTYDHLGEAIEQGLVNEGQIDVALARTLTTRYKLGMFDPPEMVPYTSTPMSVVGCEAHRKTSYEAAVKSIVLLKNKNNLLPLGDKQKNIFVVGPNAANLDCLLGSFFGVSDNMTSVLEGIVTHASEGTRIDYKPGTQWTHFNDNSLDWSLYEASMADVTIACMGLSPLMEGEEGDAILSSERGDRKEISLPQPQIDYIKNLVAGGTRLVLVLFGGSPITLGELENMVDAIVYVWYPGSEGGNAVADVLFGNVAPSGKLPITFPVSAGQLPPFDDYSMNNRTYRYATYEPLFPFGFGLSYAKFVFSNLLLNNAVIDAGQTLEATFTLSNMGQVKAEEVVQVYLSDIKASVKVPTHKLISFKRMELKPGETQAVSFTITPEMMMLVDEEGEQVLEPGEFRLTIGSCSPGQRGQILGAPRPVIANFNIK